ncbi:MAG: hypothetical protein K2O54_03195 [Prevotella sp.]|nr:hypothetical protein [Prevotella sp.]
MHHLQPNTTLQGGKYRIKRVLGQGGFGITYLAIDIALDKQVAIKEFFPKDYCDRNESTSHMTLGTASATDLVLKLKYRQARPSWHHQDTCRIRGKQHRLLCDGLY